MSREQKQLAYDDLNYKERLYMATEKEIATMMHALKLPENDKSIIFDRLYSQSEKRLRGIHVITARIVGLWEKGYIPAPCLLRRIAEISKTSVQWLLTGREHYDA